MDDDMKEVSMMDIFGMGENTKEVVTADNLVTKVVISKKSQVTYLASNEDVSKLYRLFGFMNVDLSKPYLANWRLNVIHVRGIKACSSEDILGYFVNYDPSSLEWLNDVSCNVVFDDPRAAATALIGLMTHLVQHKNLSSLDELGVPIIDGEEMNVPIPPGIWLRGQPLTKAPAVLMRFSNHTDKKESISNNDDEPSFSVSQTRKAVRTLVADNEMRHMQQRINSTDDGNLMKMTMRSDLPPRKVNNVFKRQSALPMRESRRGPSIWDRLGRPSGGRVTKPERPNRDLADRLGPRPSNNGKGKSSVWSRLDL